MAATLAAEHTAATPVSTRRYGLSTLLALLFGTVGVGYRAAMLVLHTPLTNSDESMMGLAGRHIAEGRDFPFFYYGQHYMGTIEAYLAVPGFALFGSSVLALRAPLLLCYAAFLLFSYQLTRRVYGAWPATATVGILALGSEFVLREQLLARGGYPELLAMGAGLLLLTVRLASGAVRHRLVAFAVWGLVAGLLLWDDWLIAPYLLAAGVVLVARCRRELLGWAGPLLVGGLLVGLLPGVPGNLNPSDGNTWRDFRALNGGGSATLHQHLSAGIGTGVPLATGLCQPNHCGRPEQAWSYVYLALLVLATVLAALALRRASRSEERVVALTQLVLAGAALLTVVLYVRSGSAAAVAIESARYLACLQLSTAAALWPLWLLALRLTRTSLVDRVTGALGIVVLVALVAVMLIASAGQVRVAPANRSIDTQLTNLGRELERRGITRVYSEYWTCGRLIFQTRERVACAALKSGLVAGQDRYPAYRTEVQAAPSPAYVVPTGREATTWTSDWLRGELDSYLRQHAVAVAVTVLPGYLIYQPAERIGLPLPAAPAHR